MLSILKKELLEAIIVNTMIGLVAVIAGHFIRDENLRAFVIVCCLLAIS
jgi:hypothetical protein